MMIEDNQAYSLLAAYASFRQQLTWFRMYCADAQGKRHEDFIKGFDSLKSSCNTLSAYVSTHPTEWRDKTIWELFRRVGAIIYADKLTSEGVAQVNEFIYEFEVRDEEGFRKRWFDLCVSIGASNTYLHALQQSVAILLKVNRYDEAVLAAFKYLDRHLQKILKVPSHEYYGEKLINYAFAPNSGKMQLGTIESEQQGLRNFFSGANALFRNPSAHRSNNHSAFSASVVIVMVAMMCQIAQDLKPRKPRKSKTMT